MFLARFIFLMLFTKWKTGVLDRKSSICKMPLLPTENAGCSSSGIFQILTSVLKFTETAQTHLSFQWKLFFKLYRFDLAEVMTANIYTHPTFLEIFSLMKETLFSRGVMPFSNQSSSNADRCLFDMDECRCIFIKLRWGNLYDSDATARKSDIKAPTVLLQCLEVRNRLCFYTKYEEQTFIFIFPS